MKPALLVSGQRFCGDGVAVRAVACNSPRLSTAVKAILTFGAFLVASCSTVGQKADSRLIGKWETVDQRGIKADYDFLRNGTFTGSVRSGDGLVLSQYTGKWQLRDGAILYQYTSDKKGRIPVGTKDRDKLITIDRDYFVIEAGDGSVRKYVRTGNG